MQLYIWIRLNRVIIMNAVCFGLSLFILVSHLFKPISPLILNCNRNNIIGKISVRNGIRTRIHVFIKRFIYGHIFILHDDLIALMGKNLGRIIRLQNIVILYIICNVNCAFSRKKPTNIYE